MSAWIHVRPALVKFFYDIHVSAGSSLVKWCETIRVSSIHRYSPIQKCPDAIQFSVPSRAVNVHLYFIGDFFDGQEPSDRAKRQSSQMEPI